MTKQIPQSFILFGGNTIGICKSFKIGTMCEEELLKEMQSEIEVLSAKIVLYRKGMYCIHCNTINTLCKCKKQ